MSGRPGGRGSALRTFAGAMVSFLAIRDDGEGVPRDSEGGPDFRYVATHICDYPEDCYLLLPVVPLS